MLSVPVEWQVEMEVQDSPDDFDETPKLQLEHGSYVFKIILQGIRPQIWRRFKVPAGISFHTLHNIIRVVMGWENYHLYRFDIGEMSFTTKPMAAEDRYSDEPIDTYLAEHGYQLFYEYDFGDHWQHVLTLEKFLVREVAEPLCMAANRAVLRKTTGDRGFTMNFWDCVSHAKDVSLVNGKTASAITADAFELHATNDTLKSE